MLNSLDSAFNLEAIDHVHFFVEDARQWSQWFCQYLDFERLDFASLDYCTHIEILQQGQIQIRLSSAKNNQSPVAKYLGKHPPGVAEIAFLGLDLLNSTARNLTNNWGDLNHRILTKPSHLPSPASLFTHIDHVVVNVPNGELQQISQWYEDNLHLQPRDRFHIQTQLSALKSLVMQNETGKVQIPINEPATANSQIQEFLDHNRGAGVQHLALHTDDIDRTVHILQKRGIQFLKTTPTILREEQNPKTGQALLQIFTQPLFGQPTFFLEIIQRQQAAQGFGAGNFQALFEAIEQNQIDRATEISN